MNEIIFEEIDNLQNHSFYFLAHKEDKRIKIIPKYSEEWDCWGRYTKYEKFFDVRVDDEKLGRFASFQDAKMAVQKYFEEEK